MTGPSGPRRPAERLGAVGRRAAPAPAPAAGEAGADTLQELLAAVREQGETLSQLRDEVAALRAALDGAEDRPPTSAAAAGDGAEEAEDSLWQRLGLSEGERRTVTVLFADVSGFTALAERLDPEECQVVMRDTMSALAAIVIAHDGFIEKFIGDALCAIFGAPIAHADEPERAVHSALQMHEALAELARRPGRQAGLPELSMHIGINTGMVIAGTVGDGTQFGVMGDTINTAARLMDKAESRQTFVSAETARRVRYRFLLEDMGTFEMKGKGAPVPAFNVVRELSEAEVAEAKVLRAPLTGRDDEMAVVTAAARRVAAGRGGETVLVLGEAGIGKSRVLDELATVVEPDMTVLRASARAVGARPHQLLADALGPVIETMPDGHDREAAATLMGDGSVPVAVDYEVALARALLQAAGRRPLAVLLDDFERAEPASVDLLRFLSRVTGEGPVLWVAASRPDAEAVELLAIDGPPLTRVRLQPLTVEGTAELLGRLLPGALAPALAEQLAGRAEGSPEFTEEIALALMEQGVLVEAEGEWRVVADPGEVELPSTVQELIEARIDGLSTACRLTLQDASVIGVPFTRELLALVATTPAMLDAALDELVDADLLRAPSVLDPSGHYVFRSSLVREVAYESILRRRRPEYHRRVAEALLQLHPDDEEEELAEVLAHHFELADDVDRGVHYLTLALGRAEAAEAFASALQLAERALSLIAGKPGHVDDHTTLRLLERRGVCRVLLHDYAGAAAAFGRAIEVTRAGGDAAAEARLHEKLGWYLVLGHRVEEGLSHAARASAMAGDRALGAAWAGSEITRLHAQAGLGEVDLALAALPDVVATAHRGGDAYVSAKGELAWGALALWRGDMEVAVAHLEEAHRRAAAQRFFVVFAVASTLLAEAYGEVGRYADALTLAGERLSRAEEESDRLTASRLEVVVAEVHRQLGDVGGSHSHARRSLDLAEKAQGPPDLRVSALLTLAECDLGQGVPALAQARLAVLEELLASDRWLVWRLGARSELVRGRAALLDGDAAAAAAAAQAARTCLGGASAQRERLGADLLEGEARARLGEEAGRGMLVRAVEEADRLRIPFMVAEAALALADADAAQAPAACGRAAEALEAMAGGAPEQLRWATREGPLARRRQALCQETELG